MGLKRNLTCTDLEEFADKQKIKKASSKRVKKTDAGEEGGGLKMSENDNAMVINDEDTPIAVSEEKQAEQTDSKNPTGSDNRIGSKNTDTAAMNQESLPSLRKTYFRSLESLRKKVTSLKADVKESKEELTELKGERKKLEDELFLYRSQAAAQKMDRDTFAYLRADIKESIQRKKEDIISVQETIREKSIEIDQLEQKIEEENKRASESRPLDLEKHKEYAKGVLKWMRNAPEELELEMGDGKCPERLQNAKNKCKQDDKVLSVTIFKDGIEQLRAHIAPCIWPVFRGKKQEGCEGKEVLFQRTRPAEEGRLHVTLHFTLERCANNRKICRN
mmetsp:Transcript_13815/g.19183  ORF Transcript_13815/g.19183 Transcript_13815/m.19183 type:complete len:333 (+) Transcript_13815:249-1247(+)